MPSAAIFASIHRAPRSCACSERGSGLTKRLSPRSAIDSTPTTVQTTIRELVDVRAIGYEQKPDPKPPRLLPMASFPLNTMVLNVTNQCNLACTYCYEYGEDKIVDTEHGQQSKFMSEATARDSVEFLLKESGPSQIAHLTFFGGETLLNFPVLQSTIAYARQRAAEVGKTIDFSLTTNATLLQARDHRVSRREPRRRDDLDGRPAASCRTSSACSTTAPAATTSWRRRSRRCCGVTGSRPIGARVTLTSDTLDITRIYRHLTEEMRVLGSWLRAGHHLADSSSTRLASRGSTGCSPSSGRWPANSSSCVAENRHHGFSNVKDTLEEIHKGVSKAYPCGAGLGLLGVSTDGDVALCHRFAGSDAHKLGTVRDGIDRDVQRAFLEQHHIDDKTDCSQCWARPLCSGGCYHEAHVRYGTTQRPNLHYCEWIRGWTDTCLQIYGELSERNPEFLARFDREEAKAEAVL